MLTTNNISKSFGTVKVLTSININIEAGKVLALIGENGAGKSTLMKILSGVYTDYKGEILIDKQTQNFRNTNDAKAAGIAIIHQELNLVNDLSIAENIFLGVEKTNSLGLLNRASMEQICRELLSKLHLDITPNTPVRNLKIGEQQLVEIAKALLSDSRFIIMDEPTSALSTAEVEVLFKIINELKNAGKAIVYISHKLDELYTIADNYSVLRDGILIDSGKMSDISPDQIVAKMVGREINDEWLMFNDENIQPVDKKETTLLQLKSNKIAPPSGAGWAVSLKKGEILGIFGIMGAGRTELLRHIFGLEGQIIIEIEGKEQLIDSPQKAIECGLAMVSEDRKQEGIIPEMSVRENISLSSLGSLLIRGLLNKPKEKKMAESYIEQMGIKTASPELAISNLSGGNQQKAIIAKCLSTQPKVLLLDEPTRGIDVNAKAEIYKIIKNLAAEGMGIIMASSELPELLATCHRILVMREGQITGNFPIAEATQEKLLKAAI